MIDPKMKALIDSMSYEQLLSKWRFAPVGDPLFHGETGDYYREVMARKRVEVEHSRAVQISKNVGWEK